MEYNELHIKVIQDTRREVDSWIISPKPISETEHLLTAHYDVLDMFLCWQPLIVVENTESLGRNTARVSKNAALITPQHLTPPYDIILINTYALNILEGKTITDKLAQLVDFYLDREQRHFLIDTLTQMQQKRLFMVSVC